MKAKFALLQGDCLAQMKTLSDNSIDAVVTDPPYGLSFMGKKWDYDVPSVEIWKEVLRVLKPGGHVLSFGGTRTYHRMVVNIEDAGFEIRDQVQWLYGSGFPKSHNLKEEWQGWGSALKPANEPICLARKPLEKGLTLASNVLKWGTGAINIDGTRIEAKDQSELEKNWDRKAPAGFRDGNHTLYGKGEITQGFDEYKNQGRWPANLILDEVAAESLGEPSRFFYVAKASKRERNAGLEGMPEVEIKGDVSVRSKGVHGQTGKPNKPTFSQNFHPTVKPIKLMEYLCKLITPPGGVILDPFMGSGTTGVSAVNLEFNFIGCERDEEYFKIAQARISSEKFEVVDEPDETIVEELA